MCDSTRKENGPYNERDTDDEREKKAREIIGAFFASIIWFFVDLTFVWPESHQRAYWFALAFVIAQIVQISQLRRRTIIKALAVWIIIWAVFYPFVPPNPPKETETHFWLVPASDPSPANNPVEWVVLISRSRVSVGRRQRTPG